METQVHYYKFHIKDYHAATVHLSNEEDLCYRRLMDMYYETERPIPLETDWVSRRLRLGSEVVMNVLNDYFICTEKGWISKRCDEEIENYHAKADVARGNGKLGGRPKKTQSVILANQTLTGSKPDRKLTTNHKPLKTYIPENFSISESVRKWAEKEGYTNLDAHLAYFKDWAVAGSKQYTDWDATFRNAIRGNWAKVGAGGTAKKEDWRSLVC